MTAERATLFVIAFLAGQGLLVSFAARSEHPPAPPALAQFPAGFEGWKELGENPIEPDVAATLGADGLLSRTYASGAAEPAGLLVAWFQSQRAGASQPHSPKVCLPASGWTPVSTAEMTLATAAGPVTMNRYVVRSRKQRAVVLYWYQSARRTTAGEWASKFWLVADAVRDRRSDTALVRIVVEDEGAGVEHAAGTAARFARAVYPLLRQRLPH